MYDNLIDAIRKMNGEDARRILESVVANIDDELKYCGEKKQYINNLHDSATFDGALSWVKSIIEQNVNFVGYIYK